MYSRYIFEPTLINKKGNSRVQILLKMDHLAFKWNGDDPILWLLDYEKTKGQRTIQSSFKKDHHIFKWHIEDPILWLLGYEKSIRFDNASDFHITNIIWASSIGSTHFFKCNKIISTKHNHINFKDDDYHTFVIVYSPHSHVG